MNEAEIIEATPTPSEVTPEYPVPPISLEQWLDFIIASAAHRSSNPGHQKFGESLIQRYFVTLPERYKDDKTATRYLDNMLCVVGSAMRGFAVAREQFQTHWDSLRNARDAGMKRAENWESLSPFNKDSVWGKVIPGIVGLGITTAISGKIKDFAGNAPLFVVLLYAVAFIVTVGAAMVFLYVIVDSMRRRQMEFVEKNFPAELLAHWRAKVLEDYRVVLRQFLNIAVEVNNRHYPNQPISMTDEEINGVIERHFAFKPQQATASIIPPKLINVRTTEDSERHIHHQDMTLPISQEPHRLQVGIRSD